MWIICALLKLVTEVPYCYRVSVCFSPRCGDQPPLYSGRGGELGVPFQLSGTLLGGWGLWQEHVSALPDHFSKDDVGISHSPDM